jgi:hypothetical protein
MNRPKSSAHLEPKSKSKSSPQQNPATTTNQGATNKTNSYSHTASYVGTSSPETPPSRRGGWTEFSPIKLSPLKFAPSSPHSSSSRDHSPSRDSPDLFEAHTQLDQSPSSSPATPVVYQGSDHTPPLTPGSDKSDSCARDTLHRDVTQLDLHLAKRDRSANDRSANDRSAARLLRMETRLDTDDTVSHSVPVTGVKRRPALLSADTKPDLLTRTSTVLDAQSVHQGPKHTATSSRAVLSSSAESLSRATTQLDLPLTTAATNAVKWQLIGQGALNGHVIELQEGDAVQVGRGTGCVGASELSGHKVISAQHISLVVREQHCWVTDLSSNGTWLNGLRLGKPNTNTTHPPKSSAN